MFGKRNEMPTWELADKLEANCHLITRENIVPHAAEKLAEYYDFLWSELKLVEDLEHNTGRLGRKAMDESDPAGAPVRALRRAEKARERRELMLRCAALSRWCRRLHEDHLGDKKVKYLYIVQEHLHGAGNVPLKGMEKELRTAKHVAPKCLEILQDFYRDLVFASTRDAEFLNFLHATTMKRHKGKHDD
jgi:hypothetical protein